MSNKTPKETAMAIENIGVAKSNFGIVYLLIQGFFAGAYIAFGALLAVIVGGGYTGTSPGIKKLLYGSVFPVGLIAVILTGSELFTGNCMALFPPVASKKISVSGLLKNWFWAYIGNFIGSIFVAYFLCFLPNMFSNTTWQGAIVGIADGKIGLGFWKALLRGVGCNWLVCLAVWQAVASGDMAGKIMAIWWPIMAFVALGFEHSVANMFFVPAGLMYGANKMHGGSWSGMGMFVEENLFPVTIGNIIGGMLFMGMAYWYLYSDKKPLEPTNNA